MSRLVCLLLLCLLFDEVSVNAAKFEVSKDLHFMALVRKFAKIVKCGFNPKQVMDVGASKGEWTKSILSLYPDAKFLMVEANDYFESLLKEIEQTYEIAMISDKVSPNAEFYIGEGDSAGSSMHRENSIHPFHKIVRPSHTIDELAKKHNWKPDLLKIDIQGSELQALRGASQVLKTASIVFIEAPIHNFNQGAASFRQLSALLNRAGFELYDMYGFNHIGHFMIQFDAVYVRKTSPLWSQSCTGFPTPGHFRLTEESDASTQGPKTLSNIFPWIKGPLPSRMYTEDFWKFQKVPCGYTPAVIMDVGASAGGWSIQAKEQFPNAQFFLVEANSHFEGPLKELKMRYEIALVADKESPQTVFRVPEGANSDYMRGSSLLIENTEQSYKEVKLPSTTLDAIARKNNVYPDLLKIDVQGAEFQVLKGATEVLSSATMVTLEIQIHNIYQGAAPFQKIAPLMWKAGFELYDIYGFNFLGPYIVQFDALFVRTTSIMWNQNCTSFPIPAHFKLNLSGKMDELKYKAKSSFRA